MGLRRHLANRAFAAVLCLGLAPGAGPAAAGPDELDALFARLKSPVLPEWQAVEQAIWDEWSKSGSPAMDLLLERGRAAMAAGDLEAAIAHFTALTDHAPGFPEGWNARATAFFMRGDYGLSLADIRMVLALEPRHFGALSGLGTILEEIGYPEQALAAWRAAQAIHPHSPGISEAIRRLERRLSGADL
jgi:Flp pilus assembly protein TadD